MKWMIPVFFSPSQNVWLGSKHLNATRSLASIWSHGAPADPYRSLIGPTDGLALP